MATMVERVAQLLKANPTNAPMHPSRMAEIWFPDMQGFNARPANHGGGLRKGATVALGLVGRMAKKGLMKRWIDPHGFDRTSQWQMTKRGICAAKDLNQ